MSFISQIIYVGKQAKFCHLIQGPDEMLKVSAWLLGVLLVNLACGAATGAITACPELCSHLVVRGPQEHLEIWRVWFCEGL